MSRSRMSWSIEEVQAYMSKFQKPEGETHKADPGKESVLQGKITKHCKDNGFPCL